MSAPPTRPQLSPAELRKDQGPKLLPVFIVFTILPLITVSLRGLARHIKRMKLWWDDYLVFLASALIVVQLALLVEGTSLIERIVRKAPLMDAAALKHGLGRHLMAIPRTDIEPYLLYTYLSELYYATDITLVKCSILCLYLRIFGINRKFSMLCYGMIAFVVAWGVAVFFVTIFQCKPVRAAWDKNISGMQCFNLEHFVIGTNVPNIVADAAIIALPVPLVWRLQLSRMRRVGLVTVFLLAALTTIVSILRLTFNAHIDVTDPTWNFIQVAILSTIEVSVGVCCACMPVIYPLLRVLAGRKITPSPQTSAGLEAGHRKEPLRPRHKFSQLNEGSYAIHPWGSKLESRSSDSNGHCEGSDNIPMGRIMVTRKLHMEHTGGA